MDTSVWLYESESNGGLLALAAHESVANPEGSAVLIPVQVYESGCFKTDAVRIAEGPIDPAGLAEYLDRNGWMGHEVVPWTEVLDMDTIASWNSRDPDYIYMAPWGDLGMPSPAARDYLGLPHYDEEN